ncbi:MAG: surface-adhesin E family protein [Pseudomonadota bacterium]
MRNISIAASLILITMPPPSWSKNPAITGMALQQIQAKDFETTASVVFPAIMTVLQDAGFRIQTADRDTGLITAIGSSESYMTWLPFIGFGTKKKMPIVSAFVEQRGPTITRARLNFVMSTGKSVQAFTDEAPIVDPQVYREAFEKIEKEIFVRQAMAAPLPPISSMPQAPSGPAIAQTRPSLVVEALPQWKQASYSEGISVAFIDESSIVREGQTARFSTMLYYHLEKGSDHFISVREANCNNQSFRDLKISYYLGKSLITEAAGNERFGQAAPGSVNHEIIMSACGSRELGKLFRDPDTAARLFFAESKK